MTNFDYAALIIIAVSGLLGLIRGFIKEAFSLVAYVAAFCGAVWWGPKVYPWVEGYFNQSLISLAVSYGAVFIVVLLCVGLANTTLGAVIEKTGLGPADSGLGAIFGIARGALIVLVLVVLAGYTPLIKEPWWVNAQFSTMAVDAVKAIKQYLPQDIAHYLPYSDAALAPTEKLNIPITLPPIT